MAVINVQELRVSEYGSSLICQIRTYLLEGEGMNGCINASLADKKIMINHRYMVFRQLNVCPS